MTIRVMNFKILFPLILVILAGAILFVSGEKSFFRTTRPAEQVLERGTEQSLVAQPLMPYANAGPGTQDVFISAGKAQQAPPLSSGEWVNTRPIRLEDLRGRVVLIDFWTFGCYNCRNTLPELKRLDSIYRDRGLTIIGVHTPESEYEKIFKNLQAAVKTNGIKYPVVADIDGNTWRSYDVEAWPTVVILDKQGRIRYSHIGEGAYDIQEKIIQSLVSEN
jgi:thiol-disulfide isomerase/thioredoxin